MAAPLPPLLDPAAINQAENLGLQARYIVEGFMAGEHKSPLRGFAIEFTQHREYVPGDDIRHVDWKLLGRTERLYLKQYEQETNFIAHVLVDASESMQYGSGAVTKLDYARMLAACLSYLVLLQRDAVLLHMFDDVIRATVPRTSNMQSIHNIMHVLARPPQGAPTRMGPVLHEVASQIRKRGIVILISDLFDDEETILRGIQHLRYSGSEVIVFQVFDPHELEFPMRGNVEFEGLENTGRMMTNPQDIRKSYLRELEAFRLRLRQGCERNQVHLVTINTAVPLAENLMAYLAFRQRMFGHC
jgi:uncharacterized protein (DUF58 family)